MAFPDLIDILLHSLMVTSLKVPSMIFFEAETKVLDTKIFTQHTIAELNSDFTFIVLFIQGKPLPRMEINTHVHMHTQTYRLASTNYREIFKLCFN